MVRTLGEVLPIPEMSSKHVSHMYSFWETTPFWPVAILILGVLLNYIRCANVFPL